MPGGSCFDSLESVSLDIADGTTQRGNEARQESPRHDLKGQVSASLSERPCFGYAASAPFPCARRKQGTNHGFPRYPECRITARSMLPQPGVQIGDRSIIQERLAERSELCTVEGMDLLEVRRRQRTAAPGEQAQNQVEPTFFSNHSDAPRRDACSSACG